jgi:type III secretion translocon protein HrpF
MSEAVIGSTPTFLMMPATDTPVDPPTASPWTPSPAVSQAFDGVVGGSGMQMLYSPTSTPTTDTFCFDQVFSMAPPDVVTSTGDGLQLSDTPAGTPTEGPVTGSPSTQAQMASESMPASEPAPPDDGSGHPAMSADEMDTLAVLLHHRDKMPLKVKDLQARIDDPETPPDLKKAYESVRDNPKLLRILDAGKKDGGMGKTDGLLGDKELGYIAAWPEMQQHNAELARNYADFYVPSDSKDPASEEPRPITANDAKREFYQYSESLPGKMDESTLQDIVNGNLKGKKVPPQLIAAAQFYLDNPSEWNQIPHDAKSGKVKLSDMLDWVGSTVFLNDDEKTAIDALTSNPEAFSQANGVINRDSLKKLVDDPNTAPDVKTTAQTLLDDPLLFGVLDNARKGHRPSRKNRADDGKFDQRDLEAFASKLTTTGKTPPPLPAPKVPETAAQMRATQNMIDGVADDPKIKHVKGGHGFWNSIKGAFNTVFYKVLKPIAEPIIKFASKVGEYASIACGFLELIPIPVVSQIFGVMSAAAGIGAGIGRFTTTAMDHGNLKEAGKQFGITAAITVAGVVAPGVGAAAVKGATKGAKAVKAGMSAEKAGTKVAVTGGKTAEAGTTAVKATGEGATTGGATAVKATDNVEGGVSKTTAEGANTGTTTNSGGEKTADGAEEGHWTEDVGAEVASATVDQASQQAYS